MSEAMLFTDWEHTVFIEAGYGNTWKATCGACGQPADPFENLHCTIPSETIAYPVRAGCQKVWMYAASTLPCPKAPLAKAWPQYRWVGVVAERGPLDYSLYESWVKTVPVMPVRLMSPVRKFFYTCLRVFVVAFLILTVCSMAGWAFGYPEEGRIAGFFLSLAYGIFGMHREMNGRS